MSSEIKVDTISEKTSAAGVTIDGLLIKDGAIPSIAGGKILQVVEGTHSTENLIASTTFTDSGLSSSITPSATTSKILVIVQHHISVYRTANDVTGYVQLLRDATVIRDGFFGLTSGSNPIQNRGTYVEMVLDTPSTTSSITYKTQGRVNTTLNSAEVKLQAGNNTDTIMLIEVDGS